MMECTVYVVGMFCYLANNNNGIAGNRCLGYGSGRGLGRKSEWIA